MEQVGQSRVWEGMGGEGMKGGGEEVIAILKLNAMHTYNDIACLL